MNDCTKYLTPKEREGGTLIEAFGIIDITVVAAIIIVIVMVEFGAVCGCAHCRGSYSRCE